MLSAAYMKAVGKYTGMRIFMSPYLFVLDQERISLGKHADKAIWERQDFSCWMKKEIIRTMWDG